MDVAISAVTLSRLQFALTAMFHILWPVLTIGLSLFLVVMEALWLRTRDESYYCHVRFWSKLFLLNFSVGVATGLPMEFQFGTNWGDFSKAGGDVFGHFLGFEAAMAFMLEACFLPVMMFGWKRVPPGMHFLSSCMVALGGSLSAFWIMAANSWMHTPTGGFFGEGKFMITDHWQAIFNPDMPWGVSHMWVACLEISLFVVGGISAWYLLRNREVAFFLKSFKLAVLAAVIVTPLQIWIGDGSGRAVQEYQPAKLAGIEAHWETNAPGEGAPWSLMAWPDQENQKNRWAIEIPYALSLITTHSLTGQVKGLREFPREDQPPIVLPYYAFRVMVAAGFLLFLLMLWTLWLWRRGNLHAERVSGQRKLLYAWMAAIPLSYLAMEAGWITREVGRQPWVMYGVMRTESSATNISAGMVGVSLCTYAIIYTVLALLFFIFARRILAKGPESGVAER
jgi:cytochrome d ubiquinol oxidase subunit I